MVNYNNKSTNPPSGGYGKGRQDNTIKNYNRQNNNQGNNNSNKQNNELNFTKEDALKILNPEDKEGNYFFDKAMYIGKELNLNDVSTTQIRGVYSEIKKLKYDEKFLFKLKMMKAQIAYKTGRNKDLKEFKKVFDNMTDVVIEKCKSEKDLERFKDFFQAIIAYQKYYKSKGGKKNEVQGN